MISCSKFDIANSPTELKITFDSRMENIDRLSDIVKEFMDKPHLKPHSFAVRIVLREGLTNAVRHGNRNDPEKSVKFTLSESKNAIKMEIEDQGQGFDWKSVIDAKQLDEACNTTLDHGRGVPIMNHYVGRYWYNESGTKLTIIKSIDA